MTGLLTCLVPLLLHSAAGRVRLNFDEGWRFHLGDIPPTAFRANGDEAEGGGKGAGAWGAAAPNFDAKGWQTVDLPHDWVVEQPFDPKANRNQGYRPRGIGWYRKSFRLADSDRGRHLELDFDGVATHCTVWFNGSPVYRNWNGYTSFSIDVSALAHYGSEPNVVAVRVDAEAMEGWWYEGGGIYRHTWLTKRSPVHIVNDGIDANPVEDADGRWRLPAEVTLENSTATPTSTNIEVTLLDPAGRPVAQAKRKASLAPWQPTPISVPLTVAAPRRWSLEDPALYRVAVRVTSAEGTDEASTACGFRTLRFDAKRGFFLNGRPLKIQGVCGHQDHAGVGVAVPDSLWEFRIRKLKEMGANAYRTAHNPPSAEFLDACDRLGMLVMDENRHFDPSAEGLSQLAWMVRRDRNHPSVILWSLFNEENALQGTEQGQAMARRMKALIKGLDPTRPVTAAQNGGQLEGDHRNPHNVASELDVIGINYQVDKYQKIREAYPYQPILSSEDTSQVMTRGAFETDWNRLILASYDDKFPGWASDNRSAWEAIARQPSFAGGFLWTGFDYRGEPSPFGWPAVNSYFGCLDLCGFPKTAFYIRQALWRPDVPMVKIVPHWNWPGREGRPIRVMAVTNAERVVLYLNGRRLSEKVVDPYRMAEWSVPYAAGKLEAVAVRRGKEVARDTVVTTGAPAQIRLLLDRAQLAGDGADAIPITVEVVDAEGRPVPTAEVWVDLACAGPGQILGVGNGDPTSHDPEKGNRVRVFNGLAQVIVQSRRGGEGAIQLTASAAGLTADKATLHVLKGR